MAQRGIEAAAVFRRLNLAGIGWADRGQPIGHHQAAFQNVQVAVELEFVRRKPAAVQPEVPEAALAIAPLIAEVVDGEHGADMVEDRVGVLLIGLINRHESRLPIVAVENVAGEDGLCDAQSSQREGREAAMIVAVLAAALVVQSGAVVKIRGFDQVVGDAVMRQPANVHAVKEPAGVEHHVVERTFGLIPGDAGVTRHDDGHIVAQFLQLYGQRSDHVRQATRLGEWRRFAGHHQNPAHPLLLKNCAGARDPNCHHTREAMAERAGATPGAPIFRRAGPYNELVRSYHRPHGRPQEEDAGRNNEAGA